MALTATGIGSGMDINGIVSQLMSIERAPLEQLTKRESSFNARISAFGQLKSVLSNLQTAAKALNDSKIFTATSTTVAQNAGYSATSTSGAAAAAYDIGVEQLAKAQRIATSSSSALDVAAAGTLDVVIDGTTKSLNFAGGSIENLRDAINGGELGIRASVIDNGTVKQLVLTGDNTGASNAFSLTGTGALSGLSYDPATASTDPSSSIYRLQAAQNARISVDGITVERASNTISDVIDKVTLQLSAEAAPARLDVKQNNTPAVEAAEKFVTAYNAVLDKISSLGGYNAGTKSAGELNGDSTLRGIRDRLRSFVSSDFTGPSTLGRLREVGIEIEVSGKLKLDKTKLGEAIAADGAAVSKFFAGDGVSDGFSTQASDLIDGYIKSKGLIDLRTDGLKSSIKSLERQRDALELRLERVETMYLRQFNAMDQFISSMNTTGNYLTQQLATLPGLAGNS